MNGVAPTARDSARDLLDDVGGHRERDGAAGHGGLRRPGPVGGQGDLLGGTGQRRPPEGGLLGGEAGGSAGSPRSRRCQTV